MVCQRLPVLERHSSTHFVQAVNTAINRWDAGEVQQHHLVGSGFNLRLISIVMNMNFLFHTHVYIYIT